MKGFRFAVALLLGLVILAFSALSRPCPAGEASAPARAGETPYQVVGEPGTAPVDLKYYLMVSALTFGLGIMIVVTRRNAIAILMGIELLLNSAGLNFVAFSKFGARDIIDGQIVTIFIIVIAAAEAAVALAIILNIFNNLSTVTVDEADELKG